MQTLLIAGILGLVALIVFGLMTAIVGPLFVVGILLLVGALAVVYYTAKGLIKRDLAVKLVTLLLFFAVVILAWDLIKDLVTLLFGNVWILLITAVAVVIGILAFSKNKVKFTRENKKFIEFLVIAGVIALIAWVVIDYVSPGSLSFSTGINRYTASMDVGVTAGNLLSFWDTQPKITGVTQPIVSKSGVCLSELSTLVPENVGLNVKVYNDENSVVFNKYYTNEIERFALASTSTSFPLSIPCLLPGNYRIELRLYNSGQIQTSLVTTSVTVGQ